MDCELGVKNDAYVLEIDLVFPYHGDGGREISGANHEVAETGGEGVADQTGRLAGGYGSV